MFVYGPPGPITDAFRYSNYVEGFFWITVGGLATKAARDRNLLRIGWALLGIFFVFGISDWVESTTGAWYWPWWLLAWKAACVMTSVVLVIAGARIKRREPAVETASSSPTDPGASTPPRPPDSNPR